jgi:hypothetical protein|tara:strand:+ start:3714 stop:4673 length:960 start_codon:yes stop_codon:yes gene_type:complete
MSFFSNLTSGLNQPSSLRFPVDKVEDYDDYVQFTVYKYQPPYRKAKCIGSTGGSTYGARYENYDITGFGAGSELEGTEYKKMILYMPEDIRDAHTRSWGAKQVNNLQRGALRAVGTVLDNAGEGSMSTGGFANRVTETMKNIVGTNPGEQGKAALKQLAVEAASGAGGLSDPNIAYGGLLGQIANPNLEVMFDQPGLRQFQFNWTLVPRNERESRVIKEMIWQFKKASAPSMMADGWFMKVPHVFKIQYKRGSSDNHWLNKMKACALESIAVSYTGAGSWSTLEDGAPTAVQMSLQFQELKMVISEDFGDSFSYSKQTY